MKNNKKRISRQTYIFASRQENFEYLVKIAINSLLKVDHVNANIEQATKVAEKMQQFAKEKLEELPKK